ncbi:hypothetical protein FE257_011194 [Aspergillus nanangensis]|uniref:Uncharacterized protein n=1 Tax=Aspergillus nanangensis TaxID=2582783 RepID=A0AAD4CHP6_ASPNN|nr:hypothetical protein FE257_011194 [Aspergillus nanangensis]
MEEKLQQQEQKLKEATQHSKRLQKELQDCQNQIFRSLPIDVLTDATVSEEYFKIQDVCSSWVEGLPDIQKFAHAFTSAIEQSDIKLRFDVDGFPHDPSAAQSEYLTIAFFSLIWTEIFEPSLIGASPSDQRLLVELQDGLAKVKPKKDLESIGRWKADAANAYMSREGYHKAVADTIEKLHQRMLAFLLCFNFEKEFDLQDKLQVFKEDIIDPAAKLAISMSSTINHYRWEWYDGYPGCNVWKHDLKRVELLDVSTHQKIPERRFAGLSDKHLIARYLFTMFPAIFRRGGEGQEEVKVQKAVVVVHLLLPR